MHDISPLSRPRGTRPIFQNFMGMAYSGGLLILSVCFVLVESFTLQSVRSGALTVREGCKSVLTCKTDRPGLGVPIRWRRTGTLSRGPLQEVKFEVGAFIFTANLVQM